MNLVVSKWERNSLEKEGLHCSRWGISRLIARISATKLSHARSDNSSSWGLPREGRVICKETKHTDGCFLLSSCAMVDSIHSNVE